MFAYVRIDEFTAVNFGVWAVNGLLEFALLVAKGKEKESLSLFFIPSKLPRVSTKTL